MIADRYRLLDQLGAGGMGVVYRAYDPRLEREVAIKVLPADRVGNRHLRRRLIKEARAAALLSHPGIVPVFDVGEMPCGGAYLVMELVRGRSIGALADPGLLDRALSMRIITTVAETLQAVHDLGLVHRDVKPDNIMLRDDGRIALLDFGLVKSLDAGRLATREDDRPLTLTGGIIGTPAYLPPEQARGERVTPQSDQFALAVTAHELLSGGLPWCGQNAMAQIMALLNDPPTAATEYNADLPAGVDAVLARALSKSPEDRYPTVTDFASALSAAVAEGSEEAVRPSGNTRVPVRSLPRWSPPPPDSGDTLRPPPAMEVRGRARMRRGVLIGFSAASVLAVGALASWRTLGLDAAEPAAAAAPARSEARPATAGASTLAVMPFRYDGDPELAYLGEGMVSLLSGELDGLGDVRTVDPRTLLTMAAARGDGPLSADEEQAIARTLGVRIVVSGRVVESAGQLRISATRAMEGGEALHVQVEGTGDELFALVDRLSEQLLDGLTGVPDDGLVRLATRTTTHHEALKQYLLGESAYQRTQFRTALAALRQAVELDPTFALAHYRLSVAASWVDEQELSRAALADAERHASRLSPDDRRLIEAWRAYTDSLYERARDLYRAVVRDDPDNLEAWLQLGETEFHLGPLRGRSLSGARVAFERGLALDPTSVLSRVHLTAIAIAEEDEGLARATAARALELSGPPGSLTLRMVVADTPEEQQAWLNELAEKDDETVIRLAMMALYYDRVELADRILVLALAPGRSAPARARARVYQAYLAAAGGRWSAAKEALRELEAVDPVEAMLERASLSALPFLQVPDDDIAAARNELLAWEPGSRGPSRAEDVPLALRPHDGLHGTLRVYLLGLLEARLGNATSARERAAQLDRMRLPPSVGTLADDLSRTVLGLVALKEGDDARALRTVDGARMQTWYAHTQTSFFHSRAHLRWVQAEARRRLGRTAEAEARYENLCCAAAADVVLRAPGLLVAARGAERRGDHGEAAHLYRRFASTWNEADPHLAPLVTQARRTADRLDP